MPTPDVEPGIERLKPRPLELARRSLLIKELQQLEQILRQTPKNAPDRPVIIRRLAEGYAELAAISEREQIEQEMLAESAKHQAEQKSSEVVRDTEPPRSTKSAPKPRQRTTTLL